MEMIMVERQTQLTSRWANLDAERSGLKQHQYNIIKQYLKCVGNMNNSELSHATGIRISSITARIYELRRMHEVFYVGRKKDVTTGKTCMVWGIA